MGGVDLCDRMLSHNSMGFRSRKWPVRVIMHFVDLALCNSWIQYKLEHQDKSMQFYDFRVAIGLDLVKSMPNSRETSDDTSSENENVQSPRIEPLPSPSARYSAADHMPVLCVQKNSSRCRMLGCKGKSKVKCEKCRIFLCLQGKRNWIKKFHRK